MAEPEFRWTQDDWNGGPEPSVLAAPSPVRDWLARHAWLVRLVILGLGVILFELTANAAVSTAVGCLEFGRTDFGTARWIKRTDPDRRRGRVCARCYLAWAFLRVSLISWAIMLVAIFLTLEKPVAGQPRAPVEPPPHFTGAAILMFMTASIASFLSFWVILASLRNQQKIWLGPEARWAKQQGVWPPTLATRSKPSTNQAKALFYLGVTFVAFPVLVGSIFACSRVPEVIVAGIFLSIAGLFPLGFIVVIPLLEKRILARTPEQCWPIDPALSGSA